jgi:PAS domain S-box-containing protein
MDRDVVEQILPDGKRSFLSALVDTTRQAVVVTTRAGSILSWSRGAEALYGRSSDEVLGRRLADLTADGLMTMRLHAVTICTMSGEPWSGELRFTRGDGRPVWVSIATTPLRSDDGRVIGATWLSWDVTARKHREYVERAEALLAG